MRIFSLIQNDGAAGGTVTSSAFIKAKVRAPGTGAALGLTTLMLGTVGVNAQPDSVSLPAVTVDAPVAKKKATTAKPAPARVATRTPIRHQNRQPTHAAPLQRAAAAPSAATPAGGADGAGASGSAYNPRDSQITRLPTRIVDTPQSITVVPQKVIEDQHTSTLVEALHNVPGISFLGGEGGTQGDNINIHGYSARNDIYRDGIRDPGWYTRDTFSVEEVEVLKGPSSFLFGRGSTGGVVNLTSKLPKFTNFSTLEVAGYSSPGARSTLDVNRTFGDNSAARIVLLGNDTDVADRPHVVNRRVGVAPSLTTNFTADTRATFSYIYQHDDNVPDYGIPLLPGSYFGTRFGQPAPVSKDTFYGTAEDRERVDAHILTAKFEHDIAKDWKITNETRYSNIDRFVSVRGTQISSTSPTNLFSTATGGTAFTTVPLGYNLNNLYVNNSNYFQNHTQNTLLTNQTDLTGRFRTGFIDHTLATGVELDRETRDQFRSTYTGAFDRVNVGSPDASPNVLGSLPANSTDQSDVGKSIGLYGSDQIKLNQYFELLAGIRYDHLSVSQFSASEDSYTHLVTGAYSATVPYKVVNNVDFVSWRGGAVFHPVQNSSLYFTYGTSFDPTSEYLTISGGQQNLQPTTNETYEIGAKYDLFEQRLSVTGALFKVTQNNAVEAINSTLGLYQEVGKTRVEGAEIGIAGKVTDRWSVFGGYTYMDGRVLQSAISQTTGTFVTTPGNRLQDLPRNTIAMTSTYAITRALTAGASAYYTSDRYTSSADTGRVPGYWRFDTMASYKFTEKFGLQLNILNILDTRNFETLSGFGAAQPGPGRTAIVTAKYKF